MFIFLTITSATLLAISCSSTPSKDSEDQRKSESAESQVGEMPSENRAPNVEAQVSFQVWRELNIAVKKKVRPILAGL